MYLLYAIFLHVLFFSVHSSFIDYDGILTINLQHALTEGDDAVFTDRGNFTMHGLRSAPPFVVQAINPEDRRKIKELAINNKFYKLKSTIVANDGASASFISTVKACMLAEAELNDILSISLDYAGHVITITLSVASTSTCEGAEVQIEKFKSFTTTVFVRQTESGPIPDTASYVQKLEQEREAKEKRDVKDNRSFFEKYWMYIIPVVIMMILTSAANPEAQGGNGGGR